MVSVHKCVRQPVKSITDSTEAFASTGEEKSIDGPVSKCSGNVFYVYDAMASSIHDNHEEC